MDYYSALRRKENFLMFLKIFTLSLAALGLRCFKWAFLSCSKQGLLSSCRGGFSCCGLEHRL